MNKKINKVACVALASILTIGATTMPTILAKSNDTVVSHVNTKGATVDPTTGVVTIPMQD